MTPSEWDAFVADSTFWDEDRVVVAAQIVVLVEDIDPLNCHRAHLPYMTFGPAGSRADTLRLLRLGGITWVRTGCFIGDAATFRMQVAVLHGKARPEIAQHYAAIVEAFEAFVRVQSVALGRLLKHAEIAAPPWVMAEAAEKARALYRDERGGIYIAGRQW